MNRRIIQNAFNNVLLFANIARIMMTAIDNRFFLVSITTLVLLNLQTQKISALELENSANKDYPIGFYKGKFSKIHTNNIDLLKSIEQFKYDSTRATSLNTISLEDCVNLAFENNPELKNQISRLKAARDNLIASKRQWNPKMSINGSLRSITKKENSNNYKKTITPASTESKKNLIQSAPRISSRSSSRENENRYQTMTSSSFTPEISGTIDWTFLDFQRQPNINSAEFEYKAQRYSFYLVSRDLVSEIQSVYYSLLAKKELINSYEEIAKAQEANNAAIKAQFDAGRATLQDLGQSNSSYNNTLSTLVGYIHDYYSDATRLARLVYLPKENFINPIGENTIAGSWDLSPTQSITLVQKNNESVNRLLKASQAERWKGISTLNSTLPTLSLGVSSTISGNSLSTFDQTRFSRLLQTSSSSLSENTLTRSEIRSNANANRYLSNYDLSAYIQLRWNFYDGGVSKASASKYFNFSQGKIFEAQNTARMISATVLSDINSLKSVLLQYQASQSAAESARISYMAAMARYKAGFSDVTTINQVVTLYQEAINAEISAIRSYNITLANLYKHTAIWPPVASKFADILLKQTGLPQ